MNREIIFRAKVTNDIFKGKWLQGFIYKDGEEWKIKSALWCSDGKVETDETVRTIDPKTIGQYVGLRDKNDKKIFEGDIYRLTSDDEGEEPFILAVTWGPAAQCFTDYCCDEETAQFLEKKKKKIYDDKFDGGDNLLEFFDKEKVEVIGNVYDNPELVKVKVEKRAPVWE